MVWKMIGMISRKTMWQIVVCLVVLTLAAWGTRTLVRLKQPPKKKVVESPGPLVNVQAVHYQHHNVTVQGYGEVEVMNRVAVVPQVAGKVVAVHPSLVEGGFFQAGEALIEIEPDDYQLAVARSRADLEKAKLGVDQAKAAVQSGLTALQVEQAEAQAAVAEWRQQNGERKIPPLVARKPQLADRQAAIDSARAALAGAQAQVAAAQTTLAKAELDLRRTRIAMPFDGRVLEENVEVGQYVVAGASVAQVYRTDRLQVRVPLENEKLAWFSVPLTGSGQGKGAAVDLSATFAGQQAHWRGRVVRTAGQIDPRSRLVDVMVEVKRPFDVVAGQPPLTPGLFVRAEIVGRAMEHVAAIPRYALRQGNTVWQVVDGHLKVAPVTVVRLDHDSAWISAGLADGDVIITDHLEIWTDGMKVRAQGSGEADPASRPSAPAGEVTGDE